MSLPRYPKYKDSGAEWLGEVPSDWDVRRIRFLFQIKKRIAGAEGYDVLSITQQGIKIKDLESNDGQLSLDYSKYQFVEIGDFAMNHMDLLTGYVDISKFSGVTSPDYRVFSLKDAKTCDSRYCLYIFQIGYKQKIFYPFGQGSSQLGRWRLPTEQFQDFVLPLPTHQEQIAIANFLDREIAKIDSLVDEQRRLIELLKEKRQAVISHAVTKGLNPDAPMKDSGLEIAAKIPAHWCVGALRYYATTTTGATPDRTNERYWNGGIPWVKTGEVNYGDILATEETISEEGLAGSSVRIAPPGTLLMALYGQGVTRGRVALLGIPATYNQACAAIQPDWRLDVRFLRAFLVFAYEFIREIGNETTQMNLNLEFVQRIGIVVPPIDEQRAIADFVEREMARLDVLTAEATHAIDLLKERRTALISAAVTGKIDVRGVATEEAA